MTYSARSCDATHKAWREARPTKPQYKASDHSLVGLFRNWTKAKKRIKIREGRVKIEF